MSLQQRTHTKEWGRIVAKAWADDEFKDRLLLDPGPVLLEHGLEMPVGTKVKVVEDPALAEDSADIFHLILPPKPVGELYEEEFSDAGWEAAICFCLRCGRCWRCGRCGGCGGCGCGGCGCY